jgi:hypothetical protein
MRGAIARVLDRLLRPLGLRLLPGWRVQWWSAGQRFTRRGREYSCFYHGFNCGWPPYVSERCVELAVADAWLANRLPAEVMEIGAVTPYYWPRRVATVIDPFDDHPLVTHRASLFEFILDKPVLSISTFEHVGLRDYGSTEPAEWSTLAFRKLFDEAPEFLVTVPVGYNPRVDDLLFGGALPSKVQLDFVVRDGEWAWREARDEADACRPYGDAAVQAMFPGTSIGVWANAVAILETQGNARA